MAVAKSVKPPKSAGPINTSDDGLSPTRKAPPLNGKPLETYEKLVRAAGELLGEVGFERLTTNAICARVQMTPPAFYRYFEDKYDILEVLARRLLKRQNDAYAVWLFDGGSWADPMKGADALAEWFRIAADIVADEPGAIWTMRALRALPNLTHVRLESQRMNTDRIFQFYHQMLPNIDPDLLWQRLRIRAEFGWMVDELAMEEDRLPRDVLFKEAARMMSRALTDGDD
jgi:AcrR family transcriptional regulator